MRKSKGWTQEEIADKLKWGKNTYAQIERGEVDIKYDKLRKFADIMGIDIKELLTLNERLTLNLAGHHHTNHHTNNVQQVAIFLTETQYAHELEKCQLMLEHKEKEIV